VSEFQLNVRPEAEAETQEAAQWYEQQSPGLGPAFLEVVEHTLHSVQKHPFRFPLVHGDIRRALLKRFPYSVFFRLQSTEVRVLAVMHQARNPSRWQSR
jgi:toxin ParE1/3/4